MNSMKRLLTTIILLLTSPSWAATYTVCSSGCSKTTISAIFSSYDLAPGDIVEISGGTYRELVDVGANDYGDATGQLYIRGKAGETVTISGADIVTSWTGDGPVFTKVLATQPKLVSFNGTMGTLAASAAAVDSEGEWFWEVGTTTITIYTALNPNTDPIEVGQRAYNLKLGTANDYISIGNITLDMANSLSAFDSAGDHVVVDDVHVTRSYTSGYRLRGPVTDIHLSNSTATGVSSHGSTVSSGAYISCDSDAQESSYIYISNFIATGYTWAGIWALGFDKDNQTTHVYISDSSLTENGSGVYFTHVNTGSVTNTHMDDNTDDSGTGELSGLAYQSTLNVTTTNSTMNRNAGSGAQIWGDDSPDAPTSGCSILRSEMSGNTQYGSFWNGPNIDDFTFAYNIVSSNTLAGLNFGSINDTYSTNVNVYNNTVYSTANYAARTPKTAVNLVNNIFYTSSAAHEALYSAGSAIGTHTNNLYYSGSAAVINFDSTAYAPAAVADFEATGFAVDPRFTSSTNFHLLSGSQAINAGVDVSLTQDIEGRTVPYELTPDIGAYEYIKGQHLMTPNGINTILQ